MSECIGVDEYCRTFVLGCASHPMALQVLAKPIITELTRCYDEGEYDNYSLREIIAMLKVVK